MPLARMDSPAVLNEEVELLLGEMAVMKATHKAELSAAKAVARREAIAEVRRMLLESDCTRDSILLVLDELHSKAIH
jgi:hypothetical protein